MVASWRYAHSARCRAALPGRLSLPVLGCSMDAAWRRIGNPAMHSRAAMQLQVERDPIFIKEGKF